MKECCRVYLIDQFGDMEVVEELYAEYVKSIAEKVAESESALAAADWTRLDRAAHTIKGNSLAVGDEETAKTAIALRNAAKLTDSGDAARLIDELKLARQAL